MRCWMKIQKVHIKSSGSPLWHVIALESFCFKNRRQTKGKCWKNSEVMICLWVSNKILVKEEMWPSTDIFCINLRARYHSFHNHPKIILIILFNQGLEYEFSCTMLKNYVPIILVILKFMFPKHTYRISL